MIRITLTVTVFAAYVAAMVGLAFVPDLVDAYFGWGDIEQVAIVE